MDKLTLTSALLLAISEALVLTSVLRPDWLVTTAGGPAKLGLLRSCVLLHGRGGKEECGAPDFFPVQWLAALVLALSAAVAVLVALVLTLAAALYDRALLRHAQWSGFVAVNLFCLAAIVYPLGFGHPVIGGSAFQLPNSYQVGLAYILFIMALWLCVISELFATRICLPHL